MSAKLRISGIWETHKNLAISYFYRISKQLIPLTGGVAAIDGIETVFVVGADDAAEGIYPAIA